MSGRNHEIDWWIRVDFLAYIFSIEVPWIWSGCHCQCPHHRQQGGSNFINGKKPSPRSGTNKRMKTSTRRGTYDRRIYKSHVLHVWNIYLHLSVNFRLKGSYSADFDDLVRQLLPMFACSLFRLPVPILNRKEVGTLSGLSGHWTKVFPEWLITVVSKSPKSGCSIPNGHSWLINGGY